MSTSKAPPTGLVIFDCDGVLVDSETLANRVLTQHLQAAGVDLTEAACRDLFQGRSAAQCIALIGQWLGATGAAAFWHQMQAETLVALRAVRPVNGVETVLRWLAEIDMPCCVASAGDYQKMAVTLGGSGLREAFNLRCFSAVDVAHSKPAPDLFLLAAERMGVVPHHCLVVEDSALGVEAALAAGMAVAWYRTETGPALPALWRTEGVQCFSAMAQLPAIIQQWQERQA